MAYQPTVQAAGPRAVRLAAAMVLSALLGGCLSSAEIARINTERDIERCTGYGFKPGTEAFAECRLQLDQRRESEHDALRASAAWGDPWGGPWGAPVYVGPPGGSCWHTPWGLRCEPW